MLRKEVTKEEFKVGRTQSRVDLIQKDKSLKEMYNRFLPCLLLFHGGGSSEGSEE